ncbi:hypothetical protein [Pseudoalteromonas phage C7]|uniref:hypothetical protein n=1 Tax=Pseudoalteromonas phage C7 TaxID=2510494 RepID=UPI0010179399|nr:hypothetical protein PP587_gp42 [Pseudoalteromonas phage C7]QAY17996.1 hypothetical protein [Pseudoalteromonas phage C7]
MNKYKIALTSPVKNITFTVEAKTEFLACCIAKNRFKYFSQAECHIADVKRLKTRTEKVLIAGSFALFAAAFVLTVWQLGG